ncbi:MAG: LytTR family DNA-binding domain-containing protein [Clostridia bacterium]|nr:LytTR family DNA-binding domain-containing protein [Clostridia bacterium]
MLRLAIVDDDPNDSAALNSLVAEYFQKNSQAYVTRVFNTPLDFIRSTENHDIVFMDIRMDKLDGLEVARIMRKINTDSVLIFVTHMAQLAIKGYEVDALDFIVKPADQFSINYVLDKALTRLENTSSTIFALKTSSGIISLSSNDITYVEVFDHNLVYHTTKGVYDVRGRLSDVTKKLDQKRFIMCNRSFVVNLRYVSSACNEYLVVDGTKISISKSHRKEIMQHFSNFLGENL